MAKIPTNQEQLDKEKQAEIEAKKRAEQEELEKARKEQEELEKAEEEKKRLEAQAEQARLEAVRLAAEQRALEEELAQNKKTTITMINPNQNEEPQEAEVHQDMIKYWEHEGWTVK